LRLGIYRWRVLYQPTKLEVGSIVFLNRCRVGVFSEVNKKNVGTGVGKKLGNVKGRDTYS
jgi:hypothetical protein